MQSTFCIPKYLQNFFFCYYYRFHEKTSITVKNRKKFEFYFFVKSQLCFSLVTFLNTCKTSFFICYRFHEKTSITVKNGKKFEFYFFVKTQLSFNLVTLRGSLFPPCKLWNRCELLFQWCHWRPRTAHHHNISPPGGMGVGQSKIHS